MCDLEAILKYPTAERRYWLASVPELGPSSPVRRSCWLPQQPLEDVAHKTRKKGMQTRAGATAPATS